MRNDSALPMDAQLPLAAWYASPGGTRAARLLRNMIQPTLQHSGNSRLLTLGAPEGLLRGIDTGGIERLAAIGASGWPSRGRNAGLCADPCQLPFHEAVFDQALVIHCLETAERPAAVLRELWRVLAPAGELLLVVPNRAGLWATVETNPFGQGRPYGRRALIAALADAMFEVTAAHTALAAPPLGMLAWSEPMLARAVPQLGGVHFVRAAKRDGLAPISGSRMAVPARAAPAQATS